MDGQRDKQFVKDKPEFQVQIDLIMKTEQKETLVFNDSKAKNAYASPETDLISVDTKNMILQTPGSGTVDPFNPEQ